MTDFMDRYFRYLKAGQKEYTEAEVRAIIDGAIQEERESCAKVCDELVLDQYSAKSCALAIRARGQHE